MVTRRPSVSGHSDSKRRASIANSSSVRSIPGPDLTVSTVCVAAPAQAHLDPVVAHREIALLDPLALGESRGEPIHQELALDLDA